MTATNSHMISPRMTSGDWAQLLFLSLIWGGSFFLTGIAVRGLEPLTLVAVRISVAAVVLLGPVIQPWYLLWILPLFAVTGLSETQLRWTILLTAAFAVHGMAESSATSDTLFELTDLVAIAFALAIVALILLASPRERRLVLKDAGSHGLQPDTPEQRRAYEASVILV